MLDWIDMYVCEHLYVYVSFYFFSPSAWLTRQPLLKHTEGRMATLFGAPA